jgi:DNA polymerase I-like protein with 3'-5' exonuclease and polymerase domains
MLDGFSDPLSDVLAILATPGDIGIDCETTVSRAIERDICTLQVSHIDGRKACIYLYNQPDLIQAVMQAITDSPATLIAYNSCFEMEVFLKHGGCPKHLKCAMVATKVLRGIIDGKEIPPVYTLKAVAARELAMPMDKSTRDRDWRIPMDQEAYDYAMLDADAALELWVLYSVEFDEDPDQLAGFDIINNAIEGIATSNLTGLAFDRAAHRVMVHEQIQFCEEYTIAMDAVCDEKIANHGSPAHVSRWIAEQISFEKGCKPSRAAMLYQQMTGETWKSSTVGFSLDKHVVERVLPTLQVYWPKVALYLSLRAAYQKVAKLLQAFGEPLDQKLDPGDILRCSMIPHGAKTSRMSARDPNLQQMPAEAAFRRMFKARTGRVLVLADYSQIELRVGCLIANDLVMQHVFRLGKDIHAATAENIHGIVYDETNYQHVLWRKAGKPVTFAALYGAEAATIAMNSGLDMEAAATLLESWLDAYPGIRDYRLAQPDRARNAGYIQLVSGQKIKVHESARAAQLINAPVQGSSASVMYLAITYTHQALKDAGIDAALALIVHDEILIDSAPECAQQAADILQTQMARALVDLYPEVAELGLENVAEAVVAQSWADKP